MPNATADALDLEAQAAEYPQDRGELLMEAAAAWRRAGDEARAGVLLEGLVADGGEDGCYARLELAAQRFEQDRPDEALAHLEKLARDPALHDGHCTWAAEQLAKHGRHREALVWYDRLVARLAPQRLDAVRGESGWLALESVALRGRREVRRELGLPPDATDEITPDPPEDALEKLLGGPARRRGQPVVERVLIFQRAERAEAQRRWPDDYDDGPEHFAEVERRRRARADDGVRTSIVPGRVVDLVAFAEKYGGSALDEDLRVQYCASIPRDQDLPWPPARNAACWCGSGVKYKKCCGRPGLA